MKNTSRIDQKGRSMVEMLGVLAIIGVLSVGGISGYSKAMAKFKLTKAQDQISMLLMNIRTAFATNASYDGLTSSTARDYNIAPSDMFNSDGASLNNAFGGAAYVYACDSAPEGATACLGDAVGKDQYFAISLAGLGREACISLASSDWGTDGLVGITIAPSGGTAANIVAASLPLPTMGTDGAGDKCGAKGSTNTITWVYY